MTGGCGDAGNSEGDDHWKEEEPRLEGIERSIEQLDGRHKEQSGRQCVPCSHCKKYDEKQTDGEIARNEIVRVDAGGRGDRLGAATQKGRTYEGDERTADQKRSGRDDDRSYPPCSLRRSAHDETVTLHA